MFLHLIIFLLQLSCQPLNPGQLNPPQEDLTEEGTHLHSPGALALLLGPTLLADDQFWGETNYSGCVSSTSFAPNLHGSRLSPSHLPSTLPLVTFPKCDHIPPLIKNIQWISSAYKFWAWHPSPFTICWPPVFWVHFLLLAVGSRGS